MKLVSQVLNVSLALALAEAEEAGPGQEGPCSDPGVLPDYEYTRSILD